MPSAKNEFATRAEEIRNLPVAVPTGSLGGYGPNGEVIYLGHPAGSPALLIDSRPNAKAIFASNGSAAFTVTRPEGMEVQVLTGSFDAFEKRETGPLSGNVWLDLTGRRGTRRSPQARIVSLVNPSLEVNLPARSHRIVKVEAAGPAAKRRDASHRPGREIFYCAQFAPGAGLALGSVVRLFLAMTPAGPAVVRQVYLTNTGSKPIQGHLWAFFNLHGTQKRVYDKEIWYDMGLPLSKTETVVSCTLPYSDIVQVKRVSSQATAGIRPLAATCSYLSFVGDTGQFSLLPQAVTAGHLLDEARFSKLNRFTVPTIAANQFAVLLAPGQSACLNQALLYLADEPAAQRFRAESSSQEPGFLAAQKHFASAARGLIARTPGVAAILSAKEKAPQPDIAGFFHLDVPAQPAIAQFLNSVWAGTPDLYGRNYGGRIADGVELPFRDHLQDMWPMMRLAPGRVRTDLVHTFGFMYQTNDRFDRELTAGRPSSARKPLTLLDKLHGSYPRQYPSLWLNRDQAISNDNRPFSDSAIWLIETLSRYLRQTGDTSILLKEVPTVVFADPANPVAIRGGTRVHRIIDCILEILQRYARLCADSPYRMVQIMYGDWCDPVDLFGTDRIGDASRRGLGRGVSTRLSAQVFLATLEAIDLLQSPPVAKILGEKPSRQATRRLEGFADGLRLAILRFAWEDARGKVGAGFIDSIHELKKDGKRPNLGKGEIGYTLGSMRPEREFDGQPRRVLTSMAYGLQMLLADRPYLSAVPQRDEKVRGLLKTMDELAYEKDVGLKLYTTPLANSQTTLRFVGRMGLLPSGCAENGEYHHAQAFMHRFRVEIPGQTDRTWRQFREILSSTRDEKLLGPFDSLANSYASDRSDPYFGAGMIFGFSGTADLVIETVEAIAGLDLDLLDGRRPDLRVNPRIPRDFAGTFSFGRVIHQHVGPGKYRLIPFHLSVRPAASGERPGIRINGRPAKAAEVPELSQMRKIAVEIFMPQDREGT